MSHGGGGEDGVVEPNLIPLLDLVLQLVMFFMIVANFVMEQLNEDITLPKATQARLLEAKQGGNILFLNLDMKGDLLTGTETLRSQIQVEANLKKEFAKRLAVSDKAKAEDTLVILRADKRATFEKVFQVLRACKVAGFSRLQLRAIMNNSPTG